MDLMFNSDIIVRGSGKWFVTLALLLGKKTGPHLGKGEPSG